MTRLKLIRRLRPAPRTAERGSGERGATATEYALIAALIAIVVLFAVTLLGSSTSGLYDRAASSVIDVAP